MPKKKEFADLISVLQEQAARIRKIEEQAKDTLENKNNVQEYNQEIKKKAEVLSQLPEVAYPMLEHLPREMQSEVKTKLEEFAGNAEQSMQVNSPFFMSMLLYPEDYQEGDNNDLEELIQYLRKNLKN